MADSSGLSNAMTEQGTTTKHGAWRLQVLDSVDSTNNWLSRQYDAGLVGPGHAVRAISQSAGKGRHGNQWQSSADGLYLSMLVRDEEEFGTRWALVTGLAVREAIVRLAPTLADQLHLKWPNDVMLGEAKLSGILIERAGEGSPWDLVIGVGVNLNQPDGFSGAGSVSDKVSGLTADRLAIEVLAQIENLRGVLHRGGAMGLRQAWLQHAWHRGGQVSCHVDGQRLEGRFEDLDLDGAMILALPTGEERRITGGEVHFPTNAPSLETA
ncbi:MAG: biotin--[acetyl-CoA-carboxylase] ligase [Alphaproteobacteria bacterium]|nr:biotin--[acetyl-CoA-carboxylase] ligase [Alphaproteobacteria bacterium SS10]